MNIHEIQALLDDVLVGKLEAHLRAEAEKRQEGREFKVSAWNCGDCPRKNWLLGHGQPGEAFQPRTLMTFDMGNKVEDSLIDFFIAAGVPLVRTNESRDTFDLPPIGRIRMDAYLALNNDTHVPCDAKSMSNNAYERAEAGGWEAMEQDVFASKYIAQLECYMRDPTLGAEWGVLFCYRKETSHWFPMAVPRSDERWERIKRNVEIARGDIMPDRPYPLRVSCFGKEEGKCIDGKTPARGQDHTGCGGSGRAPNAPLLSIACSYCGVKEACWGPLRQGIWEKSGKPWWGPIQVPVGAELT